MQRWCAVQLTRALMVLLTVAAGVFASASAPPLAQAAEPEALVSIILTSITPAVPQRDGTITLTGQVTNTSDGPLSNLQAVLWRSRDPILATESLTRALESAADDPIGERLFKRDYQNIPSEADRTLAPNKSTTFSLTTDVANLDLPRADGIYLFGVHIRGQTADDPRNQQTLGRSRVFLPMVDNPPPTTLRMTSVVLLSSRPSLVRPGVLADDHLATEIGTQGRLTALLAAANAANMTFAIDPALIDDLEAMRGGYQLVNGDPGTGQAAAGRWLQKFEALKKAHDGYRLLYGSPDLAALVHGEQQAALDASVAAGATVEATRSLPLLVLPTNGMADQPTIAAAEALKPAAILLSDTTAQAGTPLLAGPGVAPIVTFTASAFGGGPGPDPQNTAVHLQQRMLADTWIEATTAAAGTTHGRVRLVTSATQAKGDNAGVDAPWMKRSTLSDLLRSTPTSWDETFRYPSADRAAELSTGQLKKLARLNLSQRTYADLLVDPSAAKAQATTALALAASSYWRGEDTLQNAWLNPQRSALEATVLDQVQISSTRLVSTVAREGVEFPITIKNTLPRSDTDPDFNAVNLELVFISGNSQRLTIKPIKAPLIRAQDNVTANAMVSAKANGVVPVTAQLVTESGLKVGRPVTINVQVTQNGTTGWAIAIAAGIVLAGTTALRIRQVNRERAKAEEQDRPAEAPTREPLEALSSAPPVDVAAGGPSTGADHYDV